MNIIFTSWRRTHPARFFSAAIIAITVVAVGVFSHPWVHALVPSYVQSAGATANGGGTSIAKAFTSANAAGNTIIAAVSWDANTSGGSLTCSDTLANTYITVATQWDSVNDQWIGVCYAPNIKAGTNTVTATFGGSRAFRRILVHEYSALASTAPIDVTAKSAGAGTTAANAITSTAATTTVGGDLIFGATMDTSSTTTITAGTGFTQRNSQNNKDLVSQDLIQSVAGSVASTMTFGAAHRYEAIMVAFKAATPTVDTTPPSTPGGLSAASGSSTQINLSWTPSTDNVGVAGYRVERCQGAGCSNFAQVGTPTTASFNDSGLAPSTTYLYRVRATDAASNLSGYSTTAQATTQGVPDTTPPSVPAGLAGTGISISQINLSWSAATDNTAVTGYKVFRAGVQIGTSTTTSFQDSGLAVNTAYSYTVSAYDAAGNNSAQSAAANVSTLPDTTPPSVPAGLTLQVMSSTQITLNWTASTDNVSVTGYRIYRCLGAGCSNFALVNTTAVLPVQDSGLTPGATYTYAVTAIDAAGNESAKTAPAQATTPAPDSTPPSVSMSAPASGSTVSGTTVTVSANSTDAGSGVHDVQFFVEGNPLGSDDTTAPYAVTWNTTTVANGIYHLTAVAKDNAGNISNTSGAFTVTVNNPTSPQLPVDLVGGWPFSESTGTTTADATAYGNTASFGALGNPVWAPGKNGSGIKFNGASLDYLTINDSPTMNITGTALTLSMWINPSSGTSNDQVVFGKFWNGTGTAPHYQYGLELDRGTSPHFYIGTTSNTSVGAAMGSALPLGQWSHLAVVYDGTRVSFYLNGNLVSTPAMSGSIASRLGSTVRMGSDVDNSQYFLGSLDDVRLYTRALTQADVQFDQTHPLVPSGTGTGPTINITAPANNAQVSSIFTLTADADDAAGVQFYVDGTAVGPEDTAAPYAANWDTRTATNGAHTITARARDASGNTTVASPITANVTNSDTFSNEILATGFNLPTAMKFLPDGRMLVAELGGKIKVVPAPYTAPDATLFLDISGSVAKAGVQEGIFDFALDPNFATNHYFYVYYSANDNRDRLSRFTANANTNGTIAGSELVLYHDPVDLQSDEHHGGAIAFSNDGKIFFTTGEHFQGTPAQDLTSPFGKVHRINMDGTVPTDNPFYDGAGPNWDSIYALGFRNPYRAYYDAPTGHLFVGDVGGNNNPTAYEEVDLITAGANYGWPNCEFGTCGNPAYTAADYAYPHINRDAAITGGFVYHNNGGASPFPSGMEGNYFYADYAQNWIRRLTLDASGTVTGSFNFEPMSDVLDGPYGDIVYLTEGPDGALYYVDLGYSDTSGTFGTSKIRRISYQQSNHSPVAVAGSDVTSGPTPLTVNFNSTGSNDPEGQPITYSWDFGDGTPLSTAANPAHTYATSGVYTARLTVSDGVTSTFAPPITVSVGSAPTATINAPTDGATFRAGDVITFSGDATDPDDGTLPASAYTWTIDFLHDGHVHPGQVITGVKSGTFTIPTTGHDFSGLTRFRVMLTVTDSTGLTNTQSVLIWPQKVNLTFDTAPTGTTLYLDGVAYATPFVHDTLIGFNHTIEARNTTVGNATYTFASWSDGGAQTHVVVVPAADQTYTATYTVTTTNAGTPKAAWGFNETSGTTASDGSGNANTATLVGGVTRAASTTGHGNALSFSGSGQYLNVPNSSSLDISGSALTLSMWINPATSSTDSVVLGKFWNANMTSPYYQYGLELDGGKTPHFYIGSGTNTLGAAMGSALTANTWSHLAIVFNGSNVQFYINGTLKNTVNLSGSITARGNFFRLGADANSTQFYKGLLDDVRIYNQVQAQADIQTDMNTSL